MSKVFSGKAPSQLYMDALAELLDSGEECSPRGKKIKEIRPVIFEYLDPTKRVTFLKGRLINPFFQLAESFWIMCGRSDVKWLTDYNASIAQFSDDGVHFNAPYGERLRFWNKSDANNFILNPIDQLIDVYQKIKLDPDTRQAVAVIYNPLFDNVHNDTKDRPCNMILTFKLRNGKLDLTVFNRSNDLHWGVFGANLCQFATIQECMATWLGVGVGTYYQITDSLHIYLEDYGAAETNKILTAYDVTESDLLKWTRVPDVDEYYTKFEPRMSASNAEFHSLSQRYFSHVERHINHAMNSYCTDKTAGSSWMQAITEIVDCPDEYWRMTFLAMAAYRAHKAGHIPQMLEALSCIPDCSWKFSCLRFLSSKYLDNADFRELYQHCEKEVVTYIERKEG